MNRRRIAVTAAALMAVWSTMFASAAYAGRALQGSDESYGVSSNTKVRVCDHESDGRGVHTDAYNYTNDYYRADDQDGSGGQCDDTSAMTLIDEHRTVEEINNLPDAKGDWSDHLGPCEHC